VSYLDRLWTIRRWDRSAYRPFLVDGVRVGCVRHALARRLAEFPRVFQVGDDAVALAEGLGDVDARSAAVHEVMVALAARGEVRSPRGETYGVAESWRAPDRLRLDRGMVPLFGTRSYGVHLNGHVERPEGQALWIARRAKDKRVAPGKLDHMVAGGVSHGYGLMETLVKEAGEEAAIPPELARRAVPVGALTYVCEAESGLRDDTIFLFDLAVPAEFTPENTDGELESFALWPVAAAMARVRDTDDFKFNVGPVMIDFFFRHGWLHPDHEPDYLDIVAGLHGDFAAPES